VWFGLPTFATLKATRSEIRVRSAILPVLKVVPGAMVTGRKIHPLFARRVARELTRTGFFQAKRQVFLGDGALWIWNLADMVAPQAIEIVDLCHAKEQLSKLGDECSGEHEAGSPVLPAWRSQVLVIRQAPKHFLTVLLSTASGRGCPNWL